jgi:Family of unknown function (DUF5694)
MHTIMRAAFASVLVGAIFMLSAGYAQATDVMILATYHMANPGLDLHNVRSDDVLLPKRQRELGDIADALAKFHPTQIAVESPAKGGAAAKVEKYHEYLEGTLADSRNEVVQIGFRLARQINLPEVWGIDVQGDFPYDAVKQFAEGHGQGFQDRLDGLNTFVERMLEGLNEVLKAGSIGQGLRYMNDPVRITQGNEFYRSMLQFGAGLEQPGAALLNAWQARNNAICARLIQMAKANDRIVVVYGAGHAYLLRQCVREMPGFKLVEAVDYLPM